MFAIFIVINSIDPHTICKTYMKIQKLSIGIVRPWSEIFWPISRKFSWVSMCKLKFWEIKGI